MDFASSPEFQSLKEQLRIAEEKAAQSESARQKAEEAVKTQQGNIFTCVELLLDFDILT